MINMSNIVNTILVAFLILAVISPFIIIPIVLCYNSYIKKYQRSVNNNLNEKEVRAFIRILRVGPLLKYDKKWELLIETFNKVNKSKNISFESKKELLNILTKKGCNIEGIKINKGTMKGNE